jgi:signal peptidase I
MTGHPSAPETPPKSPFGLRTLFWGRRPGRTLRRALIVALVSVLLFSYVLQPVLVQGDSMLPTYRNGQFGFANLLAYRWADPAPGEVVVIEMSGRKMMYLKRVLAVPGDEIYFTNGTLVVNNRPVPEPYVVLEGTWNTVPEQLGPTEFFVAGDNRAMPVQHHITGATDRRQIAGRLLF